MLFDRFAFDLDYSLPVEEQIEKLKAAGFKPLYSDLKALKRVNPKMHHDVKDDDTFRDKYMDTRWYRPWPLALRLLRYILGAVYIAVLLFPVFVLSVVTIMNIIYALDEGGLMVIAVWFIFWGIPGAGADYAILRWFPFRELIEPYDTKFIEPKNNNCI